MAVSKESFFRAPIPGMSLTAPPKSRAWQKPPRFTNVEDAIAFYLPKLGEPKAVRKANAMLENGVPVNTMVDSLITMGMMQGVHTLEVGLLISPVLREMVMANAEIDGVEYIRSSADLLKDEMDDLDLRDLQKAIGASEAALPKEEVPMEMAEEETPAAGGGFMKRPAPTENVPVDMDSEETM